MIKPDIIVDSLVVYRLLLCTLYPPKWDTATLLENMSGRLPAIWYRKQQTPGCYQSAPSDKRDVEEW